MSASNGELIIGGQQRNLMIPTRLPVLASIAVIAVMIFNCGVAIAGPDEASADYFMPGCRDAASLITLSVRESKEEAARMNFCAGIVVGLSFMGELHGICVPPDTTSQQAASVVVQYTCRHGVFSKYGRNPLSLFIYCSTCVLPPTPLGATPIGRPRPIIKIAET